MKTPNLIRHASLAALAVAMVSPLPAFAAGVPAGTVIENTASASYSTGNGPEVTVDSNTVSIQVDELLDVAVASDDASAVPVTGSSVLTYTVTNTGNGPESFVLTADPAVAGNDFDVTVNNLAIDTNGNGVYDEGVDTILTNGGTTAALDPDEALTVFVLVTAPTSATDGQTSQVNLTAAASTGTGTPGTVFAGQGEGGGDAVAGASGADDSALGQLIESLASVALVKSATITDPFGGSEPVPGATITFTIVATASGSGSVTGLSITDGIPASTTYTAGTLTLESAALTDAADSDAGQASSSGVAVQVDTLPAGESRTVTFDVTID